MFKTFLHTPAAQAIPRVVIVLKAVSFCLKPKDVTALARVPHGSPPPCNRGYGSTSSGVFAGRDSHSPVTEAALRSLIACSTGRATHYYTAFTPADLLPRLATRVAAMPQASG